MSLFFYLFTFAINLWHREFVTADVTAVFVNNQHGIQRREQDFNRSLYQKGYTAEVEKVQGRFTKRLSGLHHLSYSDRLQMLGLQSHAMPTVTSKL